MRTPHWRLITPWMVLHSIYIDLYKIIGNKFQITSDQELLPISKEVLCDIGRRCSTRLYPLTANCFQTGCSYLWQVPPCWYYSASNCLNNGIGRMFCARQFNSASPTGISKHISLQTFNKALLIFLLRNKHPTWYQGTAEWSQCGGVFII